MLRQPQAAILIHGQAGVGKTSLAKEVRQKWATCMPQELTEILEEMEAELNNVNR